VDEEQFARWLIDHGFAETARGYGHATGEDIAHALWEDGYRVTG